MVYGTPAFDLICEQERLHMPGPAIGVLPMHFARSRPYVATLDRLKIGSQAARVMSHVLPRVLGISPLSLFDSLPQS